MECVVFGEEEGTPSPALLHEARGREQETLTTTGRGCRALPSRERKDIVHEFSLDSYSLVVLPLVMTPVFGRFCGMSGNRWHL